MIKTENVRRMEKTITVAQTMSCSNYASYHAENEKIHPVYMLNTLTISYTYSRKIANPKTNKIIKLFLNVHIYTAA